jgi:uncharacterized protein (TIGR02453 family)
VTSVPQPRFTPEALAFLRALKRNNDREWFKARKPRYEAQVRGPMVAVIERLARDLPAFAPDLVCNPKRSLFRIYRDTRFSDDKAPLKTHVAAGFPCRGLERHHGAGLYFEVAPGWVWIGGGMYAPETSTLVAIRDHIAANVARFRSIVESPMFRKHVGPLAGEKLQRIPRGYPKDHEAAEYLRHRQFLASREFPAEFACNPRFYATLVDTFSLIAPLVTFLNEPLLQRPAKLRM